MKVFLQARKKGSNLPEYWDVRAINYDVQGKAKTVLTSLPISDYPADKIALLYHQCWEIELGFRDIKSTKKCGEMLLAYNIVRREASHAAASHGQRAMCV
ncbi:hypothetical protein [Marinomonas maritima]